MMNSALVASIGVGIWGSAPGSVQGGETAQPEGGAPLKKIVSTPGNDAAPVQPGVVTPATGTPTPGTGATLVPGSPTGTQPAAKPVGFFEGPMLIIVLGMVGVMIASSVFGNGREKKKRAELMRALGKGDKVMTTGGIIGTVTELADDEVVVKTDESSNTKIRFTRAAVQQIIKKSGAPASTTEPKPAKETAKV
jgi:preprotein translocase subunit YajC